MIKSIPTRWSLDSDALRKELLERIGMRYSVVPQKPDRYTLEYYDTFPWQLWQAGKVLYRSKGSMIFEDIGPGPSSPASVTVAWSDDLAGFWQDFPDPLAKTLKPLTKLRRLLPKVKFYGDDVVYNVLNEDDKTVARVVFTVLRKNSFRGAVFLRTCGCRPLRGYDQDSRAIGQWIEELGMRAIADQWLQLHFEMSDEWPRSYSVKPSLTIRPEQSAAEALRETITETLANIRVNESGIIEDFDTEFLHDYRVGLRSIRGMLNQLKGVFPPDMERRLSRGFSDMARRTNLMRDLDVFLLKEPEFKNKLPENLHPGLEHFFGRLQAQRKREHAKLCRHLKSSAYDAALRRIAQDLKAPGTAEALSQGEDEPVIDSLAKKRIGKQFSKIRRLSGKLHSDTTDDSVHRLRIQCKKLRYLLEVFSPLLDPATVSGFVKNMRRLQNELGDFNDMSVQQDTLMEYANHSDPVYVDEVVALGALIGYLHCEKQQLKVDIIRLFDQFNNASIRRNFRRMLTPSLGEMI